MLTTRDQSGARGYCSEVSITSTPVIDASERHARVVAETVQSGSPALFWLHALDITTGADKGCSPVSLQASAGSGAGFHVDAPTSEQRPGLFLVNGVVYRRPGFQGDSSPGCGWLLGYNATTLAQVSVFCTSGAGAQGAGVWGSGEAPAVDASGNIFFSTGNGYFSSGSNAWADTFLKLSTAGGLSVLDYFAPFNVAALGLADLDVAAAGIALLPDSAGSAAHPHLLVGSADGRSNSSIATIRGMAALQHTQQVCNGYRPDRHGAGEPHRDADALRGQQLPQDHPGEPRLLLRREGCLQGLHARQRAPEHIRSLASPELLRLSGVAAGDLGGEQHGHERRPVGHRARFGEQRQHAARLRRHQSCQ
jgi:hypothetical protein